MNTTAHFQVWQSEMQAELAEAAAELSVAREAHATAAATLAEAQVGHEALMASVSGLRRPLPTSIEVRPQRTAGMREASGAVARARGRVENAERRVADLRDGLAGVERLIAPEPAEEVGRDGALNATQGCARLALLVGRRRVAPAAG